MTGLVYVILISSEAFDDEYQKFVVMEQRDTASNLCTKARVRQLSKLAPPVWVPCFLP